MWYIEAENPPAVHHSTEEGDARKATNRQKKEMRLTVPLVTTIIAVTASLSLRTSEASPRVDKDKVLQVQHLMKVLIHKISPR